MFSPDNLSTDELEELLYTRWGSSSIILEPKLLETRWFDHRQLHPVQATYLFGDLFTNETRRIIRAHINPAPPVILPSGVVKDWCPLKDGDILKPPLLSKQVNRWAAKIKALIKARQYADTIGIPYDFFIKTALKHYYFGRYYFTEYKKLPTPQMLNGEECRQEILIEWVNTIEGSIQYAKHSRFLIKNDNGHQDIKDHQKWLMDQMQRKSNPVLALRKFINMDLLSVEQATIRFGAQTVSRAIDIP